MKPLTIILEISCTGPINSLQLKQPTTVFKMLQKAAEQKSLSGIFEGLPEYNKLKTTINPSAENPLYLVLAVDFNSALRANSELIWKGIRKFAFKASSPFVIRSFKKHYIVQLLERVKVQDDIGSIDLTV